MRLLRLLVGCGLFACGMLTLAGGCQEPTQVTLEIALDRRARCDEIPSGVAIAVGVDPTRTESHVAEGFLHARTTSCDFGTGHIGTLVVTPNEEGRGAVVVVAGYKNNDPASCKPPSYTGCIVARRRFTFVEHTRLRMPIVIDPDCTNVPCDAFSTCSRGRCVDSDTDCANGICEVPGMLEDGGIDVVPPDSGDPRDGATGPLVDAGRDATDGEDAATDAADGEDASGDATDGKDASNDAPDGTSQGAPFCAPTDVLVCNGTPCTEGTFCCTTDPPGTICHGVPACPLPAAQYCCKDEDCPSGHACSPVAGKLGTCRLEAPVQEGPKCNRDMDLVCGEEVCSTTAKPACCSTSSNACSAACMPGDQLCCKDAECPGNEVCDLAGQPPGDVGKCRNPLVGGSEAGVP